MSLLKVLGKIPDIIAAPINLLADWGREPLKAREHQRNLEQQNNSSRNASEIKKSEELQAAKISSDQKRLDAELESKRMHLETDLEIKRKTEVERVLAEIEEMKKDKDFARMKAVSEAIMQYQQHLTLLNVSAITAIGNMQLDLREKAQSLVYEKTIKYKELQDQAHQQAVSEIEKIEQQFSGNDAVKNILYKSVEVRLVNIISTAQNFLIELNNDITVLNKSITGLTEKGQGFIENHLGQFHAITNASVDIKSRETKRLN